MPYIRPVVKGETWGALHCTDTENIKRVLDDGAVKETSHEDQYHLVCACGKEFTIWADDFPGRKSMKDCGCGASAPTINVESTNKSKLPFGMRRRRVNISMTIDPDLYDLIIERARDAEWKSFSAAIEEILRLGIMTMED